MFKYSIGDIIVYEAEGLHEAARWGIDEISATIVGIAPWWTNGDPAYFVDEKTPIGSFKIIPQNKIIKKL